MRFLICALVVALSIPPSFANEPAAPSPTRANPCPMVRMITGWKPLDDETAIITTVPNHQFKVSFNGSCRRMRTAIFAKLHRRSGVCLSPGDAIIFFIGNPIVGPRWETAQWCYITAIEKLPDPPRPPAD